LLVDALEEEGRKSGRRRSELELKLTSIASVFHLCFQGKYLEIMFNSKGEPVGAQITNYLLEKVSARVSFFRPIVSILTFVANLVRPP